MKKGYVPMSLVKILLSSAVLLMVTAALPVPVISSPKVSEELRALITDRIQVPGERDRVLQSVSRAAESGYREDELAPVIEKSLDAGVSGAGLSRMIDILVAAHEKGLPVRSYVLKIREGLIKRVNEDRLIRALEKVDERTVFAAGLAENSGWAERASDELILRTADAVAAGMDKKVLRDVYNTMATERVNRKIEPEQIMEMVKAARGYGLSSKKVGAFAKSLMMSPDADEKRIGKFLKNLSEQAYAGGSGGDLEDIMEEHLEGVGDEEIHGEDDERHEDGSDDEVSDDHSEDDESESSDSHTEESEEEHQ